MAGKAKKPSLTARMVNQPKSGFKVTEDRYHPIRLAVLEALPRGGEGMLFEDLVREVAGRVDRQLFPKLGSVMWYTKVAQRDLEANGLVERVPGQTPIRLRKKRVGSRQ